MVQLKVAIARTIMGLLALLMGGFLIGGTVVIVIQMFRAELRQWISVGVVLGGVALFCLVIWWALKQSGWKEKI